MNADCILLPVWHWQASGIFGTGLVVSNHASDCTQNAVFRDRKLKNFWGGGTSSENPQQLGAFGPIAFII